VTEFKYWRKTHVVCCARSRLFDQLFVACLRIAADGDGN